MRPVSSRPSSERLLDAGFVAVLALLGGAVGLAPITNNDIWLHLATGRWILDAGRLPTDEIFSYVAAARPYVAHEWGSELLFIGLYRLGGLAALTAFKVGAGALLAAWTYIAARRQGAGAAPGAATTGLAVFVMGAHLWVRPHVLSWLAVLATLEVLRRARATPGLLLLLLPLQIAWTNMHGSFLLGPLLVLGWSAGETLRRWPLRPGRRSGRRGGPRPAASDARPLRIASVAVACGVVCLINPYGVDLLRLPFELTSSQVFMGAVYEWQSPFTSSYRGTTMFAGFLVVAGMLLAGWLARLRSGGEIDLCELVVAIGLFMLACRMNRHVPLFGLAAAAPAAAGLAGLAGAPGRAIPFRLRLGLRAVVAVAIVGAAGLTLALGYPYGADRFRPRGVGPGPRVPEAACRYVESNDLGGDAFTTYGEGAYVVWRLWPRVRVGMDSRNSVYGDDLYRAYRESLWDDGSAARYLERWPPDLAIVGHDGPFRRGRQVEGGPPRTGIGRDHDLPHRALLSSGRFALVDFDDLSAVYVAQRKENDALIARDAYRIVHPVLLPPVFPRDALVGAVAEAERAVRRHPDAVLPRWILARAYAQSGRAAEALETLRVLARLDRQAVRSWGVSGAFEAGRLGLVGVLEHQIGHCEAARDALQDALKADPGYEPARRLLAELDC